MIQVYKLYVRQAELITSFKNTCHDCKIFIVVKLIISDIFVVCMEIISTSSTLKRFN